MLLDELPNDWREQVEEAEAARDELAAACRAAGITLPSLGVDVGPCAGRVVALVDLSRCNVPTTLQLAAILREFTERRDG